MLTALQPEQVKRASAPVKPEPVQSQRLIISKLVLRNFKSYAGTVEIGPFHKSFTSVVGPNGSGKSNVIDALLFVFGFKAKKMRQERLSDLIHNSSAYQNLDSCGVEVHFVEIIDTPGSGDDYELVEDTELVVSRTVERGKVDKSTYRINGRTSSFTEVTQLLKGKGVDLDHKRFLILQGEVESISLMKPKGQTEHEDGLLEYLEDIIGTTKYKSKIDEAGVELDRLNEEREEKVNRLKIVEKDKNSLEPEKQKAEEFINLENAICRKKNKLYQIVKQDLIRSSEEISVEINELQLNLSKERENSSEMFKEIECLEKEHSKVSEEFEKVSQVVEECQKALKKNEKNEIELKEKEKHLATKQKKLGKTIQQERSTLSENTRWLDNFSNDTAKTKAELEALKVRQIEEEQELQAIADSLKGKTEAIQVEITKHQKELEPWAEKINKKRSKIEVSQSELSLLEQKATFSESLSKEIEARIESLEKELSFKTATMKDLQKKSQSLRPKASEIARRLEALQSEEALKSNIQTSRKKLNDMKEQRQSSMSRGKVLSEVMNLKAAGKVPGICGRLGDLGIIDEEYDVAVTTACPGLNSIVVETVKSGELCLEFLKKNKLGRATFLCLDKIRDYDTSRIQTPLNVPRLFDLIKPKDKRYEKVFYHSMQNTLVAKDLETANKIAYGAKRHRVVTLDGNLIDVSGTLSGGGGKPSRGGMSSTFSSADSVSPQVIAELEKEIIGLEGELSELLSSKRELEKEHKAILEEGPRIESDVTKMNMDIESIRLRLKDAEKEMANTSRRDSGKKLSKEEIARMEQLKKTIVAEMEQLSQLEDSSKTIEKKIAQLQDKILEAGGVRLRGQKSKVDGILQQIELCDERLISLQVEKTTKEKSIAKLSSGLINKERELSDIDAELLEVRNKLTKVAEDDFNMKKELQKIKQDMDRQEKLLDASKKKQEEMSEAIGAFKALERNLLSTIEENTKKFAAIQRELQIKESQLKKLHLQKTGFEEEFDDSIPAYTEEELDEFDAAILEKEIKDAQEKVGKMAPNLQVLVEYRQKLDVYLKRAADLDDITQQQDNAKNQLDELRKRRLDEFMDGFTAISQKLKEMYQMITLGGNAELELVDTMDPFSEGIVFSVMPPKKSWKNIANLSGGEKTLSSLALVFALHHFKPTPIYVMDEIDAALDFRNVSIVANYIKERTRDAQFIIISLRNNMFELADRLVGIYKTDNTTKSITINPSLIHVY
ncbi:hypothetical protein HDU97_003841 [Phlyctochytrium planicorne]|nr:hypothetical protein HDU97_003841 [Phlyctochytrium planicorne]